MVPSSSKYKLSTPLEYVEVKSEEKSPGELGDQKEAGQHRDGNQTLMGPKTKASRQETDSPLSGRTHRLRRRAQLLESTQNMAVKMPLATLASTPAATSSTWISSQTSALRTRPDRSKTKSTVSLQKQSTSQTSGSGRSVLNNIAKKSSPRLSDGEREGTERNLPRRPVERRSDTGSSVVSMKTASSESRTSGEPCYEVTGQIRSTSLQGGPAFMTTPRNIKQGTSLPSVKPKSLARRLSEPTIPTTVSLILPIQTAPTKQPSKGPVHQTCWGVKTHPDPSSTPVLVTSDREANNVAGLDPKSTQRSGMIRNHRSVRTKLEAGNEYDLAGDENDDEHDEEEDDNDNKNLDQRVMSWLDGLDSATCRRFMRKQMAALQEIDDAD